MTSELARLEVRDVTGVFAARQVGRGLAAGLSLDRQDQIRVATALSEISRSAVTVGLTAIIAFGVDDADLVLSVTLDGEPPADGVAAAARLMDHVDTNGRALTWNGSSWAAPSWSARSPVDPDGGGLTGVSCFPGACVAVDFAGNAVVFPCRPHGGRPTGWASHVLSQQGAMEFAPSGC